MRATGSGAPKSCAWSDDPSLCPAVTQATAGITDLRSEVTQLRHDVQDLHEMTRVLEQRMSTMETAGEHRQTVIEDILRAMGDVRQALGELAAGMKQRAIYDERVSKRVTLILALLGPTVITAAILVARHILQGD